MTERPEPVDPFELDPEHADSTKAAETPGTPAAGMMEDALREGGPLGPADEHHDERQQEDTEEGPGTSLG